MLPIARGAQAWVKYANGRGGVQGHEIRLLVYDDGGDPARHRAQVQEAIERRGAVAFLMNVEVITGGGSADYITSKRVPVIGTPSGMSWAYTSPMYFPQMSDGTAGYFTYLAGVAGQAVRQGKQKLATMICVEAPACNEIDRIVSSAAAKLGLQHVSHARASIAQPDYTAECLAARNAGANLVFIVLDENSVGRLGSSCTRQGYRPTFAAPSSIATDKFKKDPNLDGMLAMSGVFPYFQAGTPTTDEFQQATKVIGEQQYVGVGFAVGWAAGKLLERATANLPEPPTSQAVLQGLWSIRNDTLGGLTPPLTFVAETPPPQYACWFEMAVKDKTWISPDRYALHCRDDWAQ